MISVSLSQTVLPFSLHKHYIHLQEEVALEQSAHYIFQYLMNCIGCFFKQK